MQNVPSKPTPRRLFVFSHPRTASNLFCKLFSKHPQLAYTEYPFLYAYFLGPEAQFQLPKKDGDEAVKEQFKHETFQHGLDKIEEDLADSALEVRTGSLLFAWDEFD